MGGTCRACDRGSRWGSVGAPGGTRITHTCPVDDRQRRKKLLVKAGAGSTLRPAQQHCGTQGTRGTTQGTRDAAHQHCGVPGTKHIRRASPRYTPRVPGIWGAMQTLPRLSLRSFLSVARLLPSMGQVHTCARGAVEELHGERLTALDQTLHELVTPF